MRLWPFKRKETVPVSKVMLDYVKLTQMHPRWVYMNLNEQLDLIEFVKKHKPEARLEEGKYSFTTNNVEWKIKLHKHAVSGGQVRVYVPIMGPFNDVLCVITDSEDTFCTMYEIMEGKLPEYDSPINAQNNVR